jgi:hypothetical protein
VDRIGRKAGLVTTTILVILGAAMSAASSGITPDGLLWMMVISRGVLGNIYRKKERIDYSLLIILTIGSFFIIRCWCGWRVS